MINKKRPMEYTNLVFPDWMLPGEWQTREVVSNAITSRHDYTLATKVHPNVGPHVDFWGRVDRYGEGCNLIFVTIHEMRKLDDDYHQKFRWIVTTGRGTHTDMSTTKFKTLPEAVKHAVAEMIKTTKKYDKINKRKTPEWDYETIIAKDPTFNFGS